MRSLIDMLGFLRTNIRETSHRDTMHVAARLFASVAQAGGTLVHTPVEEDLTYSIEVSSAPPGRSC